ncbi:hypothetical protein KIW84_044117 [Lathyrus oleraceus]|uniref:Uncharacterized protein n=1 Tax=Pisum sativum TaxID=3888 RepID=A0A9D4XFL0_PEA|nr:hypothetical protein KIW84_044117 [Pisum sativum]
MRLRFSASERRRPDQFTVLVRNLPPDMDESIWKRPFKETNYLGLMDFLGVKVDAIDHYTALIEQLNKLENFRRDVCSLSGEKLKFCCILPLPFGAGILIMLLRFSAFGAAI